MPKPRSEQRKPKVVGIVGSRRRDSNEDYDACVRMFFERCYKLGHDTADSIRIVSGGCPQGGDRFAELIAKANGLTITIHYPNWSTGKMAGIIRNTSIAQDCTVLLALPATDRTGGTEDTIRKVLALGKEVILA